MSKPLTPPSLDEIALLAKNVLDDLPQALTDLLKDIPIRIEDWPSEDMLLDLGLSDPSELTGLYRGTPLGERSTMLTPNEPEMIFLFRLPILLEWIERDCALMEVVFDVLTHEIGHHFGMDEEAVLRMEGRDT